MAENASRPEDRVGFSYSAVGLLTELAVAAEYEGFQHRQQI
jgi:hypothetical protein